MAVNPTNQSTMLQLPTAASVDGTEYVWIDQGGTSKRATLAQIADTATGWVPVTRAINTPATGGLAGGGELSSDLTLTFEPGGLVAKSAMVVADTFAINDSVTDDPRQTTFPNAMKALTGLPALTFPDLNNDYLIINRASDGLTYKINPSALGLAAGNVPAGGTTGQVLAKQSNADYDTEWANPAITLDALSIAANPTGATALSQSVTLGATLAFSGTSLQTGAGSGDVSWSANSFTTAIGANKVTDAMLRQSVGLSVVGRSASSTGNVADIVGIADQVLRVAGAGASLGFGSIDLSKSAAVGVSILGPTNGGTGLSSYALGDIIYGSAPNVLSALAGNTVASIKYLSQIGTGSGSAAPVWSVISGGDITGAALTKVDDTNVTLTLGGTPATALLRAASITAGWTGQLAVGRGGTGLASGTSGGILGFTGSTTLASSVALTANALVLGGGAGATPTPLGSLGTTTTVLHGNAAGAPTFGAVSLTADVSGTLPVTNGGTGLATLAQGDLLYGSAANTLSALSKNTTATRYLANTGTSNNPNWDQVNLTNGTTGVLPTASGGTGIGSPTAHGLLIGNGSSAMTQLAPSATSGVPLISQGASADPAYGTAVVAGGGTGATSLTAYAVLCGGTTSTAAVQSVASVGVSGQVLTSNGAGALPTFQSVSGTGTVTSIATNNGVTGGTITSSGTIGLASIATGKMLANESGSSGAPTATDIPVFHSQVFTASGTFTTPSNSTTATVYHYRMVGAGGGGGGAGGSSSTGAAAGGGAGAYAEGTFTGVAASTGITITIGSAGTAGSNSGGNGGTGGTAVIGTPVSITAGGGGGGLGVNSNVGGAPGSGGAVTGSPNMVSQTGASGFPGWSSSGSNLSMGGLGAPSFFGGGGLGAVGGSTGAGSASQSYGGGGGGAGYTSQTGGAGGAPIIIIDWVL